MMSLAKPIALTVSLALLAGCAGLPNGISLSRSQAPALVSQLSKVNAAMLASYDAQKGVAPTVPYSMTTGTRQVMDVSADASASQEVDNENADGTGEEKVSQNGQIAEDVQHDSAKHQTAADGNDEVSENFTAVTDLGGHPGHYAVAEEKDSQGKVLSGEVDFTDSASKSEKSTFTVDASTGKTKIHVADADGDVDDETEFDDGQGDIEATGSVKLPDGTVATTDVKDNKDGTETLVATEANLKVTLNVAADGSGTGIVADGSGQTIGNLVFGTDKTGTLTLTDGTKVAISVK